MQVTQPLFQGGRLWAEQRRAAAGTEAARYQLEKQRLDIRHAVAEAFWKTAALQKALRLYEETHRALQEDLEKAVRHELGESRSARIELLSTRLQNRECEMALAEAEADLLEARLSLAEAMGTPGPPAFRVPSDLSAVSVAVDEEEALRLSRSHRPEMQIHRKVLQSAVLGRRAGRGVYFPRLDLNGFYGRSGASFVETDPFSFRKDWNAGVKATWVLAGNTLSYNAFRERTSPRLGESSRTETKSQSVSLSVGDALSGGMSVLEGDRALQEEQWRYEQGLADMEKEVRLAVRRVASSWKRVETANARVEEALQHFRDVRSLVQEDRAHLGDLAAARNRVAFAQASQAQALGQYHVAVSALNRAVGIPDRYRAAP